MAAETPSGATVDASVRRDDIVSDSPQSPGPTAGEAPRADEDVASGDGNGHRTDNGSVAGGGCGPRRSGFTRYGWADDVIAPAQEFDMGALLVQEFAIQQILKRQDVGAEETGSDVLRRYRAARTALRSGTATVETIDFDVILDDSVAFGLRASAHARRGAGERFVVSFTCPDQLGVLAKVAGTLADLRCNVEGAVMSVIAKQVAVTVVASGPVKGGREAVLEALERAVADCSTDVGPAVVQLAPQPVEWPKPGSSVWHLTVRGHDGHDFLEIASGVMKKHGQPIIAVSSWVETGGDPEPDTFVTDLNFAVHAPPHAEKSAITVANEVRADLQVALPDDATVSISPVDWPERIQPVGEVVPAAVGSFIVTVIGHAEPGLVHDAIVAIFHELGASAKPVGATMAILEGYTAMTVVIEPSDDAFVPDVGFEARVAAAVEMAGHAGPTVQVHRLDPSTKDVPSTPTHELRLQVAERSGVLAQVARTLAAAKVNIVWMVSYVLDPLVGQSWPRCAMELHLVVEGSIEPLRRELRSLESSEGADRIDLREWSIRTTH